MIKVIEATLSGVDAYNVQRETNYILKRDNIAEEQVVNIQVVVDGGRIIFSSNLNLNHKLLIYYKGKDE